MIPATRQSTRREELSPSWTPHYVSAKLVFVSFWVACLTPIIENARRADDKCSVLISEIFAKDFFQKQIYVYQRICLHEIQIPTGKHAITHTQSNKNVSTRTLLKSTEQRSHGPTAPCLYFGMETKLEGNSSQSTEHHNGSTTTIGEIHLLQFGCVFLFVSKNTLLFIVVKCDWSGLFGYLWFCSLFSVELKVSRYGDQAKYFGRYLFRFFV